MIVSGGYRGTVSGSIYAYLFPSALLSSRSGSACDNYRSRGHCLGNPECGFCPSDDKCYSRSHAGSCKGSNLLAGEQCPGVCGALSDCRSCADHGDCVWCSTAAGGQARKCVDRSKRQLMCPADQEGAENVETCLKQDATHGLTLLRYYNSDRQANNNILAYFISLSIYCVCAAPTRHPWSRRLPFPTIGFRGDCQTPMGTRSRRD
jgi:hypothetical protein